MADPPRRAQAGLARSHLAHELVRVQAALHQQLALGRVDQLDRLCRCRFAVGHVDDLEAIDVETMLASDGCNLRDRSDEDWFDNAGFRRFDGAAQRGLLARMNDDGRRSRDLLRPGDQPLVFRTGRVAERADCRDVTDVAILPHDLLNHADRSPSGDASYDAFACASFRVEATTVRFGTVVDASSTPNARATRSIRSLSSAESSPRALMICLMSS